LLAHQTAVLDSSSSHWLTDVARMLPDEPAHTSSAAELWMFRRLASLPSSWTVLHSLGLARHERKPWSEIDFTIVGPLGVLLIEVKGGTVGRSNNRWEVRRADGRVEDLGTGPFQQVGGAEAATRHFLEDRVPALRLTTFGYAVATPDCRLEVDDLGIDQRVVVDGRHVNEPILHTITALFWAWAERTRRTAGLSEVAATKVLEQLCGEIAMLPDLRRVADDVEQRMVVLTEEQQRAVNEMSASTAIWLSGGAGAGKTLLAVNELRQEQREGRSALYVCHARALADYVRQLIVADGEIIQIASRDEVLRQLTASSPSGQYDTLIVDEAQDLMDGDWIRTANVLLRGGLAHGRWRVFIDPNQSLFAPMDKQVVDEWMSYRPAMQRLSRNCRCTRPIALTISALADVPFAAGGVEHAPTPSLHYTAHEGEVAEQVLACVRRLNDQGIPSSDVVVLTPQALDASPLRTISHLFTGSQDAHHPSRIRHSAIGEFKGLESRAIVIAGEAELSTSRSRQQMYVGCSRAMVFLDVILPRELESVVGLRYAKWAADGIGSSQ
jgi:hypothetical protein